MRRILFFICIIVLSFSVCVSSVDLPEDNVHVPFHSVEHFTYEGTLYTFSLVDGTSGNNYFYGVSGRLNPVSDVEYISFADSYSSFTTNGLSTIYILCLVSDLSYYDFSSLSQYRYADGDFSYTFSGVSYPKYLCYFYNNTVTNNGNSPAAMITCRFLCFRNVPPGEYHYTCSHSATAADYTRRAAGMYINFLTATPMPDILESFKSGSIDFGTAVDEVNTSTDINISYSKTDEEKIFHVTNAQYTLDQLLIASDHSSLSTVIGNFIPSLDSDISAYVSGSQSLDTTLSNMSESYSSALSSASTSEQGTLITSMYTYKLEHFKVIAQQIAKERLDSAVSDEEMEEMSDYYDAEDSLLSKFDIQAFKDALTFDLWFQQLDLVEANLYKSVFDYLINESPIRLYIAIPMSLIIVSILLGTRLHLKKGSG